jgi:autotransporter-associated beta strand protein
MLITAQLRWIRAGTIFFAVLLLGPGASAYSSNDVTAAVNAYTNAFYVVSGTNGWFRSAQNNSSPTYFWQLANEIESVIDAYEWTGDAKYPAMITNLLNGFIKNNGANWSYNGYNDDDLWAVMAFARGGQITGQTGYSDIAKANFDMVYVRAWDTNLGGGLYWLYPKNHSKNACVNGPGAIAAYLLYQIYGDTDYLAKANNIYAWERAVLYNAGTGRVYDNINTNGVVDQTPTTYNQGTFIGAADFLGQTNDALLAANYTMNSMGSAGFLPRYGIGGNNSIFNSIFIRWLAKFMKHRGLTAPYQIWLQNQANAAWNGRRASDGLSWCQWPQPTPEGTNLYSYDCIASFEAMIAVPPTQTNNATTVMLQASDSASSSSFESGLHWQDGVAPSVAHDYVVSGLTLRTPPDGANHYFAGNSLVLSNAAVLALKNTSGSAGVSVGTDLYLDDGEVADWAANTATFYAKVTLRAGGGKLDPQGNTFNFPAIIGGAGFLRVKAGNISQTGGTLIFSGNNAYTGGTIMDAAHTIRLSGAGSLGDPAGALTFSNSAGYGYGSVDLNGVNLGMGRLGGTGGSLYNLTTNECTLTMGNGDADGGVFKGSIAGGITLVKTGSGTQFLADNTNNVSGGLNVAGGSLVVSNESLALGGNLAIASVGTLNTGTTIATLDASSAKRFLVSADSIQVGVTTNISGGSPLIAGALNLGASNSLTATTSILIGEMGSTFNTLVQSVTTAGNSGSAIQTPSLTIGGSKASAAFLLGTNSILNLGSTGSRTALNIAVSPRGGSGSYTGKLDCAAGTLNAWLGKVVVGQLANGGNGNETGLLALGGAVANHLDVASSGPVVTIGQYLNGSGSGQVFGVLTASKLDAASAIVVTDNGPAILLGATAKSSGTLNLSAGTLTLTATGPGIAGGAGFSTVNLDNIILKAGASSTAFLTNLTTVNVNFGGVTFDTDGFDVAIPQILSNGGGGLAKAGAGRLILSKANLYAGNTVVAAGTLALSGSGSIGSSTQIIISNAATLSVASRSDQTLTLNNGQTLRGTGTVQGKLTALAGSLIRPGNAIGTLQVLGDVSLSGTLLLELNRTNFPAADELISSAGTIAGGGTLMVTNLGPALQAGDTFQLFNGPVTGFASVQLPAIGPGLAWTNKLAMDGSIALQPAVALNPTNLVATLAVGNELMLTWPADHIGWHLQVQTNAANTGLNTSWVDLVGSSTTNEIAVPMDVTQGSVFFRLKYP